MMKETISIIVPIYNVEKYLPSCLDSILEQTYSAIEVLLIDDGSSDNSGVICDAYAAKDYRIKVFHNENRGVSKARQFGVENSTSDYIVFVDADDWLTHDAVEALYNAITPDVDVVLGAVIQHRNKEINRQVLTSKSFNPNEYLTALLTQGVKVTPWAKIYRKSLFEQASFPPFARAEDWLMNVSVATNCRKAITIPNYVYNYRSHSDTSSIKSFNHTFEGHERFCLYVKELLIAKDLYNSNLELYAKLLFKSMAHLPFRGVRIKYDNPLIKELFLNLDFNSLSFKHKLKFLFLKNRFLTNTAAYLKK